MEVRWWPLSDRSARWMWNTGFLQITRARGCASQGERDINANGDQWWSVLFQHLLYFHIISRCFQKFCWTKSEDWVNEWMKASDYLQGTEDKSPSIESKIIWNARHTFHLLFALSPLILEGCGLYLRLKKVNLKFYQAKSVSVAPLLLG